MKYDFDQIINREGTNSIKWDYDFLEKEFGAKDLISMWVADMDFKCPQPVIDALVKRAEHGIYGYTQRGKEYYQAVVDWLKKRHNWDVKEEWIVFTPGIVPAINYIVQAFCFRGDKVVVQNPVYYPFYNAINNNGCHVVTNPLIYKDGTYTMNFADLEEKTKDPYVKLMILCSPHNPVGRVWTKEELTKLGEICLENNVLVVSDEIHSDLILKGYKHFPFASITEEFPQHSITCTAPSKTFNLAGLQTSNIIIPNDKLRTCFSKVLASNNVELTNCFGSVALTAAYDEGEEWLDQLLGYLQENVEFIDKFVQEKMPEIKFIRPQGTYLAWLDFRAITTDAKRLEKFMREKAKIALDEGYIFGEGGQGFERINFACPRSVLEQALNRIEQALHV